MPINKTTKRLYNKAVQKEESHSEPSRRQFFVGASGIVLAAALLPKTAAAADFLEGTSARDLEFSEAEAISGEYWPYAAAVALNYALARLALTVLTSRAGWAVAQRYLGRNGAQTLSHDVNGLIQSPGNVRKAYRVAKALYRILRGRIRDTRSARSYRSYRRRIKKALRRGDLRYVERQVRRFITGR